MAVINNYTISISLSNCMIFHLTPAKYFKNSKVSGVKIISKDEKFMIGSNLFECVELTLDELQKLFKVDMTNGKRHFL